MIKLKDEILNSQSFIALKDQTYKTRYNEIPEYNCSDFEFDICLNLAMIFSYLNYGKSKEEIENFYKDNAKLDRLKKRVIEQCNLSLLLPYDKYKQFKTRIPPSFYAHIILSFLNNAVIQRQKNNFKLEGKNSLFKSNTLNTMLNNINAILTLCDSLNLSGAFSLLRTLIETLFIYLAISDNEDACEYYYKIKEYRTEYENTLKFPEEFLKIVPKGASKHNYLNYGYIDALESDKHQYLFTELVRLAKIDEDYKSRFLNLYKQCCSFSHGNNSNNFTSYALFYLLQACCSILFTLANETSVLYNFKLTYNGVDLNSRLESIINECGLRLKEIKKTEKENTNSGAKA